MPKYLIRNIRECIFEIHTGMSNCWPDMSSNMHCYQEKFHNLIVTLTFDLQTLVLHTDAKLFQ
jgi:hypothetical protein